MGAIVKGDYTRTIIEGYWGGHDTDEGVQSDADDWEFRSEEGDKVTLEKIEPPVTVFKVGDTVRSKKLPRYTFRIATGGYLDLRNSVWNKSTQPFTSEEYTPLTVVEVPF